MADPYAFLDDDPYADLDDDSLAVYDQPKVSLQESSQPISGRGNAVSDTIQDIGRGVLKLPGMATGLADIPLSLAGFDRPVSRAADAIGEATGFQPGKLAEQTNYSPERQAAEQRVGQVWQDYDQGKLNLAQAALKTAAEPRVLAGTVAESLPSIGGAGVLGRSLLKVAPKLSPVAAAAAGEGAVSAGQQMESTDRSVDPQKAAAMALTTGAGVGLAGVAGGQLAKRLGLTDVDTALVGGRASRDVVDNSISIKPPPGLAKRLALGTAIEGGAEELPQSLIEQGSQNIAEDKPVNEGMARAGVQGALAGGVMGLGGNIAPNRPKIDVVDNSIVINPPPTRPAQTTVSPVTGEELPELTPDSGPLTNAVHAGGVTVDLTESAGQLADSLYADETQAQDDAQASDIRQTIIDSFKANGGTEEDALAYLSQFEASQQNPPQQDQSVTINPPAQTINPLESTNAQKPKTEVRGSNQIDASPDRGIGADQSGVDRIAGRDLRSGSLDTIGRVSEPDVSSQPGIGMADNRLDRNPLTEDETNDRQKTDQLTRNGDVENIGRPAAASDSSRIEPTMASVGAGQQESDRAIASELPEPRAETLGQSAIQPNPPNAEETNRTTATPQPEPQIENSDSSGIVGAGQSAAQEINLDENRTDSYARGLETREIPVDAIALSKDVPQFKFGANKQGVVEPLTGDKYDRVGTAPVQLWQRQDGRLELISGRHRLDLARRTGETTIPSQVHKESDGFTAQDAAKLDAELNIRDGQGKIKDYVNYFKATGISEQDADRSGLIGRTLGKSAFTIARGASDETLTAHRNDAIEDKTAVTIATTAPNDAAVQAVGLKAAQEGKSNAYIANQMRAVQLLRQESPSADGGNTDLFGFDDSAMKEAEAMAAEATRRQNELTKLRQAANIGVKADTLQGQTGGQVLVKIRDKDQLQKYISNLDQQIGEWNRWQTNPQLVGEIRQGISAPSNQASVKENQAADKGGINALPTAVPESSGQQSKPDQEIPVIQNPANDANQFLDEPLLSPQNAIGSNRSSQPANVPRDTDLFVGSDAEQAALDSQQAIANIERQKDAKRQGTQGTTADVPSLFGDNPQLSGQVDVADFPSQSAPSPILSLPKQDYIKAQIERFKTSNPKAIASAVTQEKARLESTYDADVERSLASISFEQYKALPENKNTSEAVLRQAHEQLQNDYGVKSEQGIQAENEAAAQEGGAQAGVKFSKSPPSPSKSSAANIQSWLPKRVKRLADAGDVVIVQSAADLQEFEIADADNVEGFYHPRSGKIYLVADNLTQSSLQSTLRHELLHRAEDTDPVLKSAMKKFEKDLASRFRDAGRNIGSPIERSAYQRVIDAGTPLGEQIEEFRAYLVTEYSQAPDSFTGVIQRIFADFVAAIRAALVRSGLDFGMVRSLTPADLAAMSKYGAKVASWKVASGKDQAESNRIGDGLGNVALTSQAPITDIRFSRNPNNPPPQNNNAYNGWLNEQNQKLLDSFIYKYQDRFIDLKRQMEKIVKNGGKIKESEDARLGEEVYHQRAASRIKSFHDKELSPLLRKLGLSGIKLDYFQTFLHARHAPSRNKIMAERNPNQTIIDANRQAAEQKLNQLRQSQNPKKKDINDAVKELTKWNKAKPFQGTEADRLALSGMSDQDASAFISAIPNHKIQVMIDMADKIDKIINDTLDLMVSYGMETPATIQALKNQWQHYVPLHRDEAHPIDNNFGHPIGSGFSVSGIGLKQATGSNAEVTNILAHIAAAREQMIRRGEKNRVTMRLANFINAHPDPDFAELGKIPMLDKLIDGLATDIPTPHSMLKQRPNIVMMRVNGKDVVLTFNEHNPEAVRFAMSFKNMDGSQLDNFESFVAKGTRWLAAMNTQYNLVFGVINLMRDVSGAAINLSSTPLRGKQTAVLKQIPKSILAIAGAERGWRNTDPALRTMYERFNKAGATTGYAQMFDGIKDRARSIEKEYDKASAGELNKLGHAFADFLSDFNTVMENSTRLATFMTAVDAGFSDDKAASIAKNITVNFNRKGAQTTKIGAYYAFFNAAVQGTARLAETLSGPQGRKIMMGGVAVGMASTLAGILMMGDDEWEKIPEFVRERSLILPVSKDRYVAIPMPLGFHVLPNIGRTLVESLMGSDRKPNSRRFLELAASIFGAFNPLGGSDFASFISPTVADPAVALWRNQDWKGNTIYFDDFSRLNPTPGFTRTKDTATPLAKGAAEVINKATGGTDAKQGLLSPTPDQIDYIFGQLFGGTGREILKGTQAVSSVFNDEELPTYKIPLIGRLVGSTADGATEKQFYYDNVLRLNEHKSEIKWLREHDRGNEVGDYIRVNPEAKQILLAKSVDRSVDRLKEQRQRLKDSGASGTRIRQIDDQIIRQMKRLNDAMLKQ